MKNLFKLFSVLLILSLCFACSSPVEDSSSSDNKKTEQNSSGGSGTGKSDGNQSGGGKTNDSGNNQESGNQDNKNDGSDNKEEQKPELKRTLGVTFSFEGAQALAKLEAKTNTSRAVTSADDLGDLVKIMSDGSMENAITIGENCSLSDIVAIYKSPLETSKDIFIVLSGESVLGYEEVEKTYEWGEKYIANQEIRVGQLICLHEDGSIADILKKDNATDSWNSHMSLKTESVTFDANGNLYFISSDNGDMIYQFNPKTNELIKMVAAVENTWYEKMQLDKEGQWIFVCGSRNSSYFLRAIPINNPNSFVNIFYSSNDQIHSNSWVYDDKSKKIFFIVIDGNKSGLFTATKAGGFKDKTFYHSCVGEGTENDLFESFCDRSIENWYWSSNLKSNGIFDATKAIKQIIDSVPSFSDFKTGETIKISLDDVDIRFDKYNSSTDSLKALAVLTAGKKNEDAFEALNNSVGMTALYSLYGQTEDGKPWFEYVTGEGHRHNFLADILYVKNTDILLNESDEVLFTYNCDYARDDSDNYLYDEYGNNLYSTKAIKGSDLFIKTANGLYNDENKIGFVYHEECEWIWIPKTFAFKEKYHNSDNSINSKAILECFFSNCNVEGVKEFTLRGFKDDEQYGSLYSTLKNEEAIEWINSDVERLNLFGKLSGMYYGYNSLEGKDMIQFIYPSFMNMLSKTCFISGTEQKAITWNWNRDVELNDNIPGNENLYYSSSSSGFDLSATDTGVYYEYYNTSGTDPYYYIVQVADSEGKFVELVNKLPLPAGKVVQSEKNKDRIILQYSVMDSNGAELGYHHIYSVEMATGKVTNCFDNVPNRNSLEVVSFNTAGDLLYYSAVRGTSVENGIVNIVTNEYNPLTVQRKMVAVYTFN